jgi:hypothetical protein
MLFSPYSENRTINPRLKAIALAAEWPQSADPHQNSRAVIVIFHAEKKIVPRTAALNNTRALPVLPS